MSSVNHIDPSTTAKQDAFMKLYEPAHARLSRYCSAMLTNKAEAQDLMSETLLAAFEQFDQVKKAEAFNYYLFGIASKLMRKKMRRKKFLGVFNQEVAEQKPDHGPTPDTSADIQLLHEALKKLPAEIRETVVLFEISGFPLKEIAEMKQTNLNTVKTRLSRGRTRLKELMGIHEKKKKEAVTIPLTDYQDNGVVAQTVTVSTKQRES